jgi:hypothetical protein
MAAIWASLIAALVKYQLPLAAGLGTWFTFIASKQLWFQKLGDWGKKAVVGVAAFLVVLVINAIGGQVSADLQGMIDAVLAALLGGGAAATPVALAYRFGRVQPSFTSGTYPGGANRRGAASIAVMLALASLGLLLVACGPAIRGVQPGVGLAVVADSIGGQYDCNGSAPDVACLVTVTDSASGAVIVDNERIALGQVMQLPTRPCLSSGRVAYTGRFTGVTATGRLGPVYIVTGGTSCDLAGNGVRGTIILQFRPAGS